MTKKILSTASLVAAVLTLPFAAQGAEITWTGASNTTFNTAGNWVGGVAPANAYTDVAVFGTSVTANQPSVGANQGIGGLKFLSSSGGWIMGGANTLTLDGSAGGFIDDSFNTGGTDTLSNSILFTGANGNVLINAGGGGGGNLNIAGNVTFDRSVALRVASGTVTMSNVVVNSGYTATKDGPGTLVINGSNGTANTGSFTLSGGTLVLGNDGAVGLGTFTFNRNSTLQANKDVTLTNTINGPQGLGIAATVSGSNNITFTGNWSGAGSDMYLANRLASGKTLSLGSVAIASGSNGKAFAISGTGDTVINGVISDGSTGASGMVFGSTGTTTLKGVSTYTGGTTVKAGKVTLNGATGSLVSTGSLTMFGTGVFNYDNVGAAGATSQTFSTNIAFSSGDASVKTTRTAAQTVSLVLSSVGTRSVGATRNFAYEGTVGTIGTDSKISFTTAPAASALIDQGTFFAGSEYAAYDSGGYVRAMNYTTDNAGAGIAYGGTNTTFTAAGAASKHVDLGTTGVITAAGTETINTLRIGGTNTVTLNSGSTLTISNNGILKTGGNASSITGGAALRPNAGNNELVIRTDAATDALTIGTAIVDNSGTTTVTKTGAGTLTLTGTSTHTGTTHVANGTLVLDNATDTLTGAISVSGGGVLDLGANSDTVSAVTLTDGSITGTTGVLTATSGYTLNSGTVSAILAGGGVSLNNRGETVVFTRANTYTGATTITNGALNIRNSGALGASGSTNGTTVSSNGQLQMQGSINVASEALTLNGTGVNADGALLNISNNNTWGGVLTLGSAARINSDAGTLTISNATAITGATFGLTVGGYGDVKIDSVIGTTSGTLTKDGYGKLTLTAANTYTGLTTVSSGVLNIQNAAALGTSAGGVNISGGSSASAALQLQGGITVTGEELTIRGVGYNMGGALQNVSGDNTWAGTITNAAASRINSDAGTLTLSNGINGANNALTFGGAANIVVGAITNSTGALTKDGAGTLTLTGTNTYSGTTLLMGGTLKISSATAYANTTTISNGTLLLANQNALQSGIVSITTNSGAAIVFDSSVSGKAFTIGGLTNSGGIALLNNAATPEAITLTLSNTASSPSSYSGVMTNTGAFIKAGAGTFTLSGSTAALSTGSYQVSAGRLAVTTSASFNSRNRIQVDSGATFGMGSAGLGIAGLDGAGTFDFTESAGDRNLRFSGAGSYTFSGLLTNTSAKLLSIIADLKEGGTQVLAGTSAYKGGTTMRSGTLALNYSNDNSAKLNSTGALALNGGTIDLRGGTGTETVASTTFGGLPGSGFGAQANITRSSGSKVLALNAITFGSSGALNIASNNIATTTSANTNGLLGGGARITVGGADWAANDGSGNIVAYSGYTTYTNNNAGVNTNNYLVTGSASSTVGVAAQTLKITTTGAGQSLNLGTQTLTIGNGSGQSAGILFVGSDNYTITAGAIGASGGGNYQAIQNYGTGKLTLAAGLSHHMSFFGTGYTVLAANSTANAGINVGSGTVEFSSNAQIGSPTGTGGVSIYGGRLVANTAGGNISLTNGAGGLSYRTVTLGSDNACLDVIGGGTLTVGGVISSPDGNGDTPLTLGSTNSSGKILLGGANTYTGTTRLEGGTVSVSQNANLGNTNNWIDFSGNGTLETTASFGSARVVNIRSGKSGTFAPATSTELTLSNVVQGAGALNVNGAGTVTLNGQAFNTGGTTISAGTLKLGASNRVIDTGAVTVSGGTLDMGGYSDTVGAVTLSSGTITNGTLTGSSYTVEAGTVAAVLAGSGGLTKSGAGTVSLTAANSFTGAVAVNQGVLNLNSSTGGAATAASSVSVASGATLLVSQNNQVNNSAAVTLSGGTIQRASGVSEVFGSLAVNGTSFLNFGTGTAGTLSFGTYAPSSLLTVQNFFEGNVLTFGSDLTSTINNGSLFSFSGGFTSSWSSGTSTFTITAIPETSTVAAAIGLAGLMLWPSRRRLLRDAKSILGLRRPARDRMRQYRCG